MTLFSQSQQEKSLFEEINKVLFINYKLTHIEKNDTDAKNKLLLDLKLHNTRLDAYFKKFTKVSTSDIEGKTPSEQNIVIPEVQATEDTQASENIPDNSIIYEFPFVSIKLGADEWFHKSTAILFTGDRVKLLRKVNVY